MENRFIAIIIAVIAILLAASVLMMKTKEDAHIEMFVEDKGSCYLDDGTCLHKDRDLTLYIIGFALSGILLVVASYIGIFLKDKRNVKMKEKSDIAQEAETEKEFQAFLRGFSEDERKILKGIRKEEGITQSTLRFKTGLSKAHLSGILRMLEKKEIVARKPKGKTYELFLRE